MCTRDVSIVVLTKIEQSQTSDTSGLADRRLILLLGVRLSHGESEDINRGEEDDDLHSDDDAVHLYYTKYVIMQTLDKQTGEL